MSKVGKFAKGFLEKAGEKFEDFKFGCSSVAEDIGTEIGESLSTPLVPGVTALGVAVVVALGAVQLNNQERILKDTKKQVVLDQNLSPKDAKKLDVYSYSTFHPFKNDVNIAAVKRFGDSVQVAKKNPTFTPSQVSRVLSAWK